MSKSKTSAFNLKKFLSKKANYEGVQGYALGQTRAMQNCCRAKLQAKKSAHESWQECMDEFQKTGNKLEWISKFLPDEGVAPVQKTAKTISQDVAKPKIVMEKKASFAGMNVSDKNEGSLIYAMVQNGYKATRCGFGGNLTLQFEGNGEKLLWNKDTGRLETIQ